ncbi:MAG: chemotaxis-specific protein-glutamate methyltransferase CheB [Candidatus Pacebacteria bacterium]|nr:chemotaxis-specific protein-glutamate methyltransferase CheB [Candidatus Paceibacterota bacterium]
MKNLSKKIRVLIADDSFFMCKILNKLLKRAGDIEIVGEARDGIEAVEMAKHLSPDVITMDYNMPFLTGATATRQIVSEMNPPPAIIMLSAYTKEGADETLEGLKAGAFDFLCKPSGELSLDMDKVADELIAKIRSASKMNIQKFPEFEESGSLQENRTIGETSPKDKIPPWLLVSGASTGGPPVLEEIIPRINSDMPTAILVVQHIPPHFTKNLAERLDKMSGFFVREAADGDRVNTGEVLVAPGDYHMVLEFIDGEYVVKLNQDPPREGLRPSVDVLFESVALNWKNRLIAVELTGMGKDGCSGIEQIKKIGGFVIAQSKKTSVADSMPTSVIEKGFADQILSPLGISQKINLLVGGESFILDPTI